MTEKKWPNVGDLVEECALGRLPYDGPHGLVRLVAELGFPTDGLARDVAERRRTSQEITHEQGN
jgi:hypothetical protein